VKIAGVVALVLVLSLVVVLIFGDGDHGPGQHATPQGGDSNDDQDDHGGHTPPDHGESSPADLTTARAVHRWR